MGLRGRATVRDYAYGGGGFSPPEAGPPQADVPSSIGVLVWFGLLGWSGDGRSETRVLGAGGQPAVRPRGPAVADEVSGEFSSTRLRSTIRRDGSAYSASAAGCGGDLRRERRWSLLGARRPLASPA